MSFIAPNKLICSDTVCYRMCLKYQISQIQTLSNAHNDPLRRHLITETVDVFFFLIDDNVWKLINQISPSHTCRHFCHKASHIYLALVNRSIVKCMRCY